MEIWIASYYVPVGEYCWILLHMLALYLNEVLEVQVCLLADVIQHFVDQKLDFDCAYVYEDVQKCIEYIHRSGNLHREILSDPAKYLQKNVVFHILSMLSHLHASQYTRYVNLKAS